MKNIIKNKNEKLIGSLKGLNIESKNLIYIKNELKFYQFNNSVLFMERIKYNKTKMPFYYLLFFILLGKLISNPF